MSDKPDTDGASSKDWPTCAQGSEPGREVCTGVRVGSADLCRAHLSRPELEKALGSLEPGGKLDLRGTPLGVDRLRQILAAMRDPGDGRPRIGDAQFDGAKFINDSSFEGVVFNGRTSFDNATFEKMYRSRRLHSVTTRHSTMRYSKVGQTFIKQNLSK